LGDADRDSSHLPKLIIKIQEAMSSVGGELDFEKAAELKEQFQDMETYLL
jgi:excinuclease UvrABC helicase subunit UvrB